MLSERRKFPKASEQVFLMSTSADFLFAEVLCKGENLSADSGQGEDSDIDFQSTESRFETDEGYVDRSTGIMMENDFFRRSWQAAVVGKETPGLKVKYRTV